MLHQAPSEPRTDSRVTKTLDQESLFQGQSSIFEDDKQPAELASSLEAGIMHLHSNLKSLEGRYIDLANFYKQELLAVRSSDVDSQDPVRRLFIIDET